MKKLDVNNIIIEYYHKTKQYYRVNNLKHIPINKNTALNWLKKGARLWEYYNYDWKEIIEK